MITLKDIKKEYGIKFKGNPRMKLQTWLKRKGFKPLSKALKIVESK